MGFGALKSPLGYLKILHTVLGAVALSSSSYFSSTRYTQKVMKEAGGYTMDMPPGIGATSEMFFFIIVSYGFMFTSFALLLSYLFEKSSSTVGDDYGKDLFETVYHLVGFIFIFSASACLFSYSFKANLMNTDRYDLFMGLIFALIAGILNSFLFLANFIIALMSRLAKDKAASSPPVTVTQPPKKGF